MILPPYLDRPYDARPDGLRYEVLDHAYGDVRVPHGYGSGEDTSPARPLAEHLAHDHTTGRTCDHRGKWDVLVAEAPEVYDAEDNLKPREFRLVATCTACGVVTRLDGELAPLDRPSFRIPVEPLRANDVHGRELYAQQQNERPTYGAVWTVYRQRGDGRGFYAVGVLEAGQTTRGRDYVIARYGHPNASRHEDTPVVEAPTAIGALRKLAKLDPPTAVPIPRYVPGGAADGYRGTWAYDRVPDPTTAEAAQARADRLATEAAARIARNAEQLAAQRARYATVTPLRTATDHEDTPR